MSPRHELDEVTTPHNNWLSGWRPGRRSTDGARRPGLAAQVRPLARRVHFLAGLLVAPFLLMLCLTGLVYVFSPQIHNDLYAAQFYVDEVGASPHPITEQIAAAMAAHPEAQLRSVVPPPEPDRTTRVNLSVSASAAPGATRSVYVDPYTNYLSGEMITVDGRTPANLWLRELHDSLHLGVVGRLYSEIASSWLPVIALGGLVVWIAKSGRRRRSAREVLVPIPRGSESQTRLRAVHGPLGLWLTIGLLVMSITGLTMSRFAGWGLPDARVPTLARAPVEVVPGAAPIGVDQVVQVARAEGLRGEIELTVPAAPSGPFVVAERSPGLPIHKSSIAVDPYTATITERIGWDDYPFLAQLRELGVQLHTGTLFGLVNQILLALLMVAAIALIFLGYRMWWLRSPYQAAPAPALRQLTGPVGVAVLLVTVALGWLMPAFGVSLVAFVVIDLVVKAVRQPQERTRRGVIAGAVLLAGTVFGAAVLAGTPTPVSRHDAAGDPPDLSTPGDPEAPGVLIHPPPQGQPTAPNGAPRAGPAPVGDFFRPDLPTAPPASSAIDGFDGRSTSTRPGDSTGTGSAPSTPTDKPAADGSAAGSNSAAGSSAAGRGTTRNGSSADAGTDAGGSADGTARAGATATPTPTPTPSPTSRTGPTRAPAPAVKDPGADPAAADPGVVAGLVRGITTVVNSVGDALGSLLGW